MRNDQWDDARERIMDGAIFLTMGVNAAEGQAERAADAGAALAAEVYRYIEDLEGGSLDALREAYATFMGLHSGNFHAPQEVARGT